MKTGELAAILGRNVQTIRNWTDQPEIAQYLSDESRGMAGNAHRTYTESDVLILNTVRELTERSNPINWDEIAQVLSTGYRNQQFPKNAISRDDRLVPMPQAEQAANMMVAIQQRDAALAEAERMKQERDAAIAQREADRQAYEAEIRKLIREAATWQARYEMLKEQEEKGQGE